MLETVGSLNLYYYKKNVSVVGWPLEQNVTTFASSYELQNKGSQEDISGYIAEISVRKVCQLNVAFS